MISWLIVTEVITPDGGRGVTWLGGNGNDPTDEDRAGLMRWQLRGLMSEVEAHIRTGEVSNE